jgi:Fe-S-cluster-containing dehydrogenase component
MREATLLVDLDRCIRCYACEVACKQENDLPPGPRWCGVVTVEPREVKGELCTDFVFTTCVQCEDPLCAKVCPSEAFQKRDDGIILIDDVKCKGCGFCENACPFGVIHIHPGTKKAWKCSFCFERLEKGMDPACVQHCAGGAIQIFSPEDLMSVTDGRHRAVIGKACYTSSKWKLVEPFSLNLSTSALCALTHPL